MNDSTFRKPESKIARRGVSLFEVLISIVVAAIGVFGVMVLIPFAVRTAEIGLNEEAAMTASQNFLADFKAYGYQTDPASWWFNPVEEPGPSQSITPGRIYCLDPIGLADVLAGDPTAPAYEFGAFPYVRAGTIDFVNAPPTGFPPIERITLYDRAGVPFSKALAQRLCMLADDLVFNGPPAELMPPQQVYFDLGGTNVDKRQFTGNISLMAFLVPFDDATNKYRMYVVASDSRNVPVPGDPLNGYNQIAAREDRVFEVSPHPMVSNPSYQTNFGGGDVDLVELTTPAVTDRAVRRNDWVMMLNETQLSFYRVIEDFPQSATERRMTLQGPDFDNVDTSTPAYVVLLPGVINVFERTIRIEPNSNYN